MAIKTIYVEASNMIPVEDDPRAEGDERKVVDITVPLGSISLPEINGIIQGWASSFHGIPADQRCTVAKITIE